MVGAVYLVGRGIAEFWLIDVTRARTYRDDWGGPHLAGVLAVHTGPAIIIMIAAASHARRRRRRGLPAPPSQAARDRGSASTMSKRW